MLNGFASTFSAIAAAQQRMARPMVATPLAAAVNAHQSLFKQVVPSFGAPLVSPWASRLAAIQQHLVELSPWVAHRSAADEVADVMQDRWEMWTMPRERGLAHVMGRFWRQAVLAARDVARRAVEEVTGQRARIDLLSPVRPRGPNGHTKRRSTLMLSFTQQQYVIRELLIRAPGYGGPSARTPEALLGEPACLLNNRPSLTRATTVTTASPRGRRSRSSGAAGFLVLELMSPCQVATRRAC